MAVAAECYQDVFKALRARSMLQLARVASEILNMPVVVTDAAFVVRAKYPDVPLYDEQWDANIINRQIEPRFINMFTSDNHFTRHDQAGKAILIDWGHFEQAPRLTAVMHGSGGIVGYFAALARDVELEEWHYEAADVIAEAFSLMMEANEGTQMVRDGMSSPVLYTMLDGPIDEAAVRAAIPNDFATENIAPYVLLCLKPRNPHNAPLELYLGSTLSSYFDHFVQTVHGGCLYVLACEVPEDARDSMRARLLCKELERQELECGVSRMFDDLVTIRARAWEASSALHAGEAIGVDGPYYHYEDLIVDVALDVLSADLPENALEHPALAALKQRDLANGTEYFRTLKAYFESGFDKKRTSEKLHIHRNTLQYRLDRIAPILQHNIDKPYLSLYFALEGFKHRCAAAGTLDAKGSTTAEGGR